MASEGPRDRELHRYYQPWLECFHDPVPTQQVPLRADGHVPQSSQDKALSAFAQLGALRLGVKRGVVTLIDSTNQYILAEATRTMSLMDDTRHAEGDELWLGNAVMPRAQGTSPDALAPPIYTAEGPGDMVFESPALVVNDFANDTRYCTKEYAGPGGIAFYAGVPITTKRGYSIGVYTVTHDLPRNGLNAEELRFMVDMATICVDHLETIKNDRARARGERLVQGIGTFIEGRGTEPLLDLPDTLDDPKTKDHIPGVPDLREERPVLSGRNNSSDFKGMTISDQNAAGREQYPQQDLKYPAHEAPANGIVKLGQQLSDGERIPGPQHQQPSGPTAPLNTSSAPKSLADGRSQYLAIFDRASRILRTSMMADGVVFLDASAANLSRGTTNLGGKGSPSSHVAHSRSSRPSPVRIAAKGDSLNVPGALGLDQDLPDTESYSSDNAVSGNERPGRTRKPEHMSEIIAKSLKSGQLQPHFDVPESRLRRIIRRFPQGKVYQFDREGNILTSGESSESGHTSETRGSEGGSQRQKPRRARTALLKAIPDARTIVLLPLWDLAKERWHSVVIFWSNNPSKLMNIQDDLSYLTAFGNSVMNEVSRLNLAVSDTAKATFLANISHELRSPLHGILGSIEFLHDSPLDDFQSNMVIAVETCGKTLLDTVNHVLDFAKLNNLSKAGTKKKDGVTQATTSDSSLIRQFDLAVVLEEAVEAVYAGQVFRAANADALEGKGPSLTSSRRAWGQRQDTKERTARGLHQYAQPVHLTLNIDDIDSWQVTSQPGAVRRVVMNLLGNSLKYTEGGAIDVSLEIDHSRDNDGDSHLHTCISVIDTGRGMSEDFVKNHAFTAFSQEDSLASGTGLGLSIIRQIVDSLGGKIDLRSQKDLGTEIKIWLSFPKTERGTPARTPKGKDILHQIQERTGGMRLCSLNPETPRRNLVSPRPGLRDIPTPEESLSNLAVQWFSMDVSFAASMDDVEADFFVYCEPPPIEYLLDHHGNHAGNGEVPIILICQNAFQASSLRANGLHTLVELGRIIEIVSQPLGPRKLAKVLHRCMQRLKKLSDSGENVAGQPVTLQTRQEDEIESPAPHSRPKAGRSVMSSDNVLTRRKLDEQRPGTSRHHTATDFPNDKSKEIDDTKDRHKHDQRRRSVDDAPSLKTPGSMQNSSVKDTDKQKSALRVLVVDDNAINLQLLETMMRKAEHAYESATNGQKAVDAYKRSAGEGKRFKYILMDISMPVMNGIQATKEIRKWERERKISEPVNIIALTGMGDGSSAKAEAKETGFDRFLSKPVKFKDLSSLLI